MRRRFERWCAGCKASVGKHFMPFQLCPGCKACVVNGRPIAGVDADTLDEWREQMRIRAWPLDEEGFPVGF